MTLVRIDADAPFSPRVQRLLSAATERADLPASDRLAFDDFAAAVGPEQVDALAILATPMFLALEEGSLAVELSVERLVARLGDLAPETELRPWIAQALAELDAGSLSAAVAVASGDVVPDGRPLVVWRTGARRFLYFQKHLKAERDLYRLLGERVRAATTGDAERWADAVRAVRDEAPLRGAGGPIRWDADQLVAWGLALLRGFAIVSGGPGAGKTSIVLNVLRTLVRGGVDPSRIALAAPTGRAAQRLGDSLRAGLASLGDALPEPDRGLVGLEPATFHQLLDYHPSRGLFRRHEENPVPADVVLVDETSMVSVDQMASLLRALEPTTKLLLLGDKDQLPSVDAGAVLGQLVGRVTAAPLGPETRAALARLFPDVAPEAGEPHWLRDSIALLRTNHRSHPAIRAAAAAINAQDPARFAQTPALPAPGATAPSAWAEADAQGGCFRWLLAAGTPNERKLVLRAWAENVHLQPLEDGATFLDLVRRERFAEFASEDARARLTRMFAGLDRARLLTLVREGPWGCDQANAALREWLRRVGGFGRSGPLFPGVPVLVTRNDRSLGLSNGDVGLTVAAAERDEVRVVFARQGTFAAFAPETLPSHELGFALTVHKSQGSEYRQVLTLLPPEGGRRLLTKELLYTAVTRAKRLAVVCGSDEAISAAVARRIERESGMTGA